VDLVQQLWLRARALHSTEPEAERGARGLPRPPAVCRRRPPPPSAASVRRLCPCLSLPAAARPPSLRHALLRERSLALACPAARSQSLSRARALRKKKKKEKERKKKSAPRRRAHARALAHGPPPQQAQRSDLQCSRTAFAPTATDALAGVAPAALPGSDGHHVRFVAGPHVLCGTAGLNESRVAWADQYVDDWQAYVRGHGYQPSSQVRVQEWRGPRFGRPLNAPANSRAPPLVHGAGGVWWAWDPFAAPPPSSYEHAAAPPPVVAGTNTPASPPPPPPPGVKAPVVDVVATSDSPPPPIKAATAVSLPPPAARAGASQTSPPPPPPPLVVVRGEVAPGSRL
jgi:hypothetical protein